MLDDLEIQLGDHVIDRVTDYEGTVTAICFYLDGTIDVCVTPKTDDNSKRTKGEYISIQYLKVLRKADFEKPTKRPMGFIPKND